MLCTTTAGAARGAALTAVSKGSAQRTPSTPQRETHERSICSHLLLRLLAHFSFRVSLDSIRSVVVRGKLVGREREKKKQLANEKKKGKKTLTTKGKKKSNEIPWRCFVSVALAVECDAEVFVRCSSCGWFGSATFQQLAAQ